MKHIFKFIPVMALGLFVFSSVPVEADTIRNNLQVTGEHVPNPRETGPQAGTEKRSDYNRVIKEFYKKYARKKPHVHYSDRKVNYRQYPDPELARVAHEKGLLIKFNIGWGGNDPAKRFVGWGVERYGWQWFVDNRVKPRLDETGAQRVHLHNMFGVQRNESMQLCQFGDAVKQRDGAPDNGMNREALEHITNVEEFVEAFRPLIESGIEVVGYIGTHRHSRESKDIEARYGKEAAIAFGLKCMEPLLKAGMSIGLDASAPAARDSVDYATAVLLRDKFHRNLFTEARPDVDHGHFHSFNFLSRDSHFDRNDSSRSNRHPVSMVRYPNWDYHDENVEKMIFTSSHFEPEELLEKLWRWQQEHENLTVAVTGVNRFTVNDEELTMVEYLRLMYKDFLDQGTCDAVADRPSQDDPMASHDLNSIVTASGAVSLNDRHYRMQHMGAHSHTAVPGFDTATQHDVSDTGLRSQQSDSDGGHDCN